MMPPSMKRPPAARIMASVSRAVCGETALRSAKAILRPVFFIAAATPRATLSASPGLMTEITRSQVATSFSIEPQSLRPAAFARFLVRSLRPSSAVCTLMPLSLMRPAIAWPMSPGLTMPTFWIFISVPFAMTLDSGEEGMLTLEYNLSAVPGGYTRRRPDDDLPDSVPRAAQLDVLHEQPGVDVAVRNRAGRIRHFHRFPDRSLRTRTAVPVGAGGQDRGPDRHVLADPRGFRRHRGGARHSVFRERAAGLVRIGGGDGLVDGVHQHWPAAPDRIARGRRATDAQRQPAESHDRAGPDDRAAAGGILDRPSRPRADLSLPGARGAGVERRL